MRVFPFVPCTCTLTCTRIYTLTCICLLLTCPLLSADKAKSKRPQPEEQVGIASISIVNPLAGDLPDARVILDNLLQVWEKDYSSRVALVYEQITPAMPMVSINIENKGKLTRVRVTLTAPGYAPKTLISTLSEKGEKSLPSVAAGSIFYLWASLKNFLLPSHPTPPSPPQLTGMLLLESLSLFDIEVEKLEPTGCAGGISGPVIAFSRRFLHLGPLLEISTYTMWDINSRIKLPEDFIITDICLNPLDQPVLFNANNGTAAYFDAYTGETELFQTGLTLAEHFTGLPGGGFALLKDSHILRFYRKGNELRSETAVLPPGIYSGLASDPDSRLWIFDLKERRVRILNRDGEDILSIKPVIEPAVLILPQLLKIYPDGSFLLGSSGELWRFSAQGLPLWRLTAIEALHGEALPAFFRICLSKDGRSFFMLDPQSMRILKFRESSSETESELGAHQYLISPKFHGTNQSIPVRAEEKRALCLAVLAQKLKRELLLPEAERMYGKSLALYRSLRSRDPVDPLYPAVIRGLTRKRSAIRGILFEERILDISVPSLNFSQLKGFRLILKNRFMEEVEDIRITARLAGLSWCSPLSNPDRLEAGEEALIPIFLQENDLINTEEDLRLRLSVQISFIHRSIQKSVYFQTPMIMARPSAASDGKMTLSAKRILPYTHFYEEENGLHTLRW